MFKLCSDILYLNSLYTSKRTSGFGAEFYVPMYLKKYMIMFKSTW